MKYFELENKRSRYKNIKTKQQLNFTYGLMRFENDNGQS